MGRAPKEDEHPGYYRIAPLGVLQVYLVSESDLEKLARGPEGQLELNFAAALLPMGVSLVITLQTATFTDRWFLVYSALASVCLIVGTIQIIKWLLVMNNQADLLAEIRSRMPPEPIDHVDGSQGAIGPGLPLEKPQPEG